MSGGALDLDLSEPVATITREQWLRVREEEPVHVVQPERGGYVYD